MSLPEIMTIEELARASDVSTRNIREFQTRGLLAPPRRVGRVGYYTVTHLDRLLLITSLQGRGFGIEAIRELLDAHRSRRSLSHVLGLEIMLAPPWVDTPRVVMSEAEVGGMLPGLVEDDAALARALELGLLERTEAGFAVPSLRILEAGAELAQLGVSLEAILDQAEALQDETARMARRFFELVGPILKRQLVAHVPLDRTLERLRPLGLDAVDAFLRDAMGKVEAQVVSGLANRGVEPRAKHGRSRLGDSDV